MPRGTRRKNARAAKQRAYGAAVTLLISTATLLALVYLFFSDGSLFLRAALGAAVLAISGHMIATANGLKESFGAYLLGSKRGTGFIEYLAKRRRKLWMAFADWGLTFSFGLLTHFMFRKQISRKMLLLGIATIVFVLVYAYPYMSLVLSFIKIPQVTASISNGTPNQAGSPLIFYAFVAVSVLGGFSLFTMLLIVYGGASVLYTIFLFLSGLLSASPNYSLLNNQVPGVAPLIPGVTIPLFAGLVSLIILLVVHEVSHGVLARIAKVRIKSIGVVLFGIVPLGAFVEPDEEHVKRLPKAVQDRILIAGISAGMLFSLIFFFITLALLLYILPNISTGGVLINVIHNYPAYNATVPQNSTILGWNIYSIRNSFDLRKAEDTYLPGSRVSLLTDKGVFVVTPSSSGTIGVFVAPAQPTFAYQAANFLYAVAVLSFGLNFFVAIFNLLPIPGFDGWRIYENSIKNKRLLRAVSYLIIGSILASALPWLWTAF